MGHELTGEEIPGGTVVGNKMVVTKLPNHNEASGMGAGAAGGGSAGTRPRHAVPDAAAARCRSPVGTTPGNRPELLSAVEARIEAALVLGLDAQAAVELEAALDHDRRSPFRRSPLHSPVADC
ncbi:hypothetical protein [Streptomyces sp. NPDC046197]|uniref:hypothetical protein n=1 Tax=Streptomyces sp. NPDC046197 TaxID=3154337 RepID=UPI0033D2884B